MKTLLVLLMTLFSAHAFAGEKDLALFNVIKEVGAPVREHSSRVEIGLGKVACGVYSASGNPAYYCGSNELFNGGKDEFKDFNPEQERALQLYNALVAHGVQQVGDKATEHTLQPVESVKCVQSNEGAGSLSERTTCELAVPGQSEPSSENLVVTSAF